MYVLYNEIQKEASEATHFQHLSFFRRIHKASTPPRLAKATPPAPPARGKLPEPHFSEPAWNWGLKFEACLLGGQSISSQKSSNCKLAPRGEKKWYLQKPHRCWHILSKLIETCLYTYACRTTLPVTTSEDVCNSFNIRSFVAKLQDF